VFNPKFHTSKLPTFHTQDRCVSLEKNMSMNNEYQKRINKALAFIDRNLDSELSLSKISKIAFYSPYHFHRLFKAACGETVTEYITRKRIEKAASILINDKRAVISEIYAKFGFNSNSTFTKTFKKFYGVSPSKFKKLNLNEYSKISKIESKNGQKYPVFEEYICNINQHLKWINMNANIQVKNMPLMKLAYVSHSGSFKSIGKAYQKIINWGEVNNIITSENFEKITIYHDNPKISTITKTRTSACIIVEDEKMVNGDIHYMTNSSGNCVVGRFEIAFSEFEKAWDGVFVWLTEKGYEVDDARNCFDIVYNNFLSHPEQKSIMDICIPIM